MSGAGDMVIGALLIGVFIGTISGLVAFGLGFSAGAAFGMYAGMGALGVVVFAGFGILHGTLRNTEKYTVRGDLPPLQRS